VSRISKLQGPIPALTGTHTHTHTHTHTCILQYRQQPASCGCKHIVSQVLYWVLNAVFVTNIIMPKEGQNSICLSQEAHPGTPGPVSTPQQTTSWCHNRAPLSTLRWLHCTVTVRLPLLSYVYSSVSCPFIVCKTGLCLPVTYINTEYIHCTQFALSMNTVTVSMGQY